LNLFHVAGKISSILLVAEIIYAALVALVRRTFLHLTVWLMFQARAPIKSSPCIGF